MEIELLNTEIEKLKIELNRINIQINEFNNTLKIIGKKVSNKMYGEGTIISQNSDIIEVKFNNEHISKFQFPTAFIKGFIKFESNDYLNVLIELSKLEDKKIDIEKNINLKEEEIKRISSEIKKKPFSNKEITMLAIPTKLSFDDCIKHNIYCCEVKKDFSKKIQYLALYNNKCINAIGKVNKIIVAKYVNNEWKASLYYGTEQITNNDIEKIEGLRTRGLDMFSCDIGNVEQYYFIMDEFLLSTYIKTSIGPLQGKKYFNLCEILETDKMPELADLIKIINQKEW